MSIGKIYSLNITKGRCKDTDEWEVYGVERTHEGYSPLETMTASTTNQFEFEVSGVTYMADEYYPEIGFLVYNSKYENGVITPPMIANRHIPIEIAEKFMASETNPYVPFIKGVCPQFWSNECPFILTDYGVFMACGTFGTILNYDGQIHSNNKLYYTRSGAFSLSNGKWFFNLYDSGLDESYLPVYVFGSSSIIYAYMYNTTNGEVIQYYCNSANNVFGNNGVVCTLQTGLTNYDTSELNPILKDENDNTYFFNMRTNSLEEVSEFIISNNGIIYRDSDGRVKYKNNNGTAGYIYDDYAIVPNDFDFDYVRNNTIKHKYGYDNDNEDILVEYIFVDNNGYADVYFIDFLSDNVCIYKCIADGEYKIKSDDINILNYEKVYDTRTRVKYDTYLLVNSNNILFTINQCIIYPSIRNNNFTMANNNHLYSKTDNQCYYYEFSEETKYSSFYASDNFIRNEVICGNKYGIYNLSNSDYNGFILEDEGISELICKDYEIFSKINSDFFPNSNDFEYLLIGKNGIICKDTPHFHENNYTNVVIPIENNIIPNGAFYGVDDNLSDTITDIICNYNDTITFGDFSFYGSHVERCYASNIVLGFNSFSSGNSLPIVYAPYGADYSETYKNHPYWVSPTYNIIPTTAWTNELSFEFTGDTITIMVNNEIRTFTESPVVINEPMDFIGLTYSEKEKITNIISLPVNEELRIYKSRDGRYYPIGLCDTNIETFDMTNINKFALNCVSSSNGFTSVKYVNMDNAILLKDYNIADYNSNSIYFANLFYGNTNLETISMNNMKFVLDKLVLTSMFYNCSNLTSVSMKGWNVEDITISGCPFNSGCTSLQTIDLTDSSENLYMFIKDCLEASGLNDVEIIYPIDYGRLTFEFETPDDGTLSTVYINGVTYTATSSPYTIEMSDYINSINFGSLNYSITRIIEVPNTYVLTEIRDLFGFKDKLTEIIGVEDINTYSMTSFEYGFRDTLVETLNLSNWNTSKVTDLSGMFYNCTKLTTLNVSWDISHIPYNGYSDMFTNCTSLTSITVKSGTEEWWLARLTDAGIQDNVTITSV